MFDIASEGSSSVDIFTGAQLTTPKRPVRNSSVSPYSPNQASDASDNHTPKRTVRGRHKLIRKPNLRIDIQTPRISHCKRIGSPDNEDSDTTMEDIAIKTNSFYKPNNNYVNPLERMALGKPKIWVQTKYAAKKKKKINAGKKNIAKVSNLKNRKAVSKKGLPKHKSKVPLKEINNVDKKNNIDGHQPNNDISTPVKSSFSERDSPRSKVRRGTPDKAFNDLLHSKEQSNNCQTPPRPMQASPCTPPRHSPRTALCLELGITPPTPKAPPKRKFFKSRSPKKIIDRFTAIKKTNGNFQVAKTSPKRQKSRRDQIEKPLKKPVSLNKVKKEETSPLVEDVPVNRLSEESSSPKTRIVSSNDKCLSSPLSEKSVSRSNSGTPTRLFPIFNPDFKTSPKTTPKARLQTILNRLDKCDKEQMLIDVGQKSLGPKECRICGMLYSGGENQDELLHAEFHKDHLSNLRFTGWKSERVLSRFGNARIIKVLPTDKSYMVRKIQEVCAIMDRDLGFSDSLFSDLSRFVYFIYVDKKSVVGCIVAEPINKAYRVLPEDKVNKEQVFCCGTEPVPVLCGINRVWTALSHRRKKIATKLLDCVRCHFSYGYQLAINELAFSDPSPMGRSFASSYMKSETFLVYK